MEEMFPLTAFILSLPTAPRICIPVSSVSVAVFCATFSTLLFSKLKLLNMVRKPSSSVSNYVPIYPVVFGSFQSGPKLDLIDHPINRRTRNCHASMSGMFKSNSINLIVINLDLQCYSSISLPEIQEHSTFNIHHTELL